ncbi:MAG: hypothetical protein ABI977_36310 [Acidobacteriota bacterium]
MTMQIACKRFSCQKAVEVCYWSCKYRRDCKDWHGALDAVPGTDAVTVQLSSAAKKSGRVFDPQTMILNAASKKRGKKSQAAIVSKSPSAHLQSRDVSTPRGKAASKDRSAPIPHTTTNKIKSGEVRVKMTEDNLDTPMAAETTSNADSASGASTKSAAAKAKPKPIVKPKPVSLPNGPVYLLLFANGKYKELRESELNSEAASVLKDPSLRLIKGQTLIPQISFKAADE